MVLEKLKEYKIVILIISVFISVFISAIFIIRNTQNNRLKAYLENFNCYFSGVVIDKKVIDPDWGIVSLELDSSTVEVYDVRDSSPFYYCVIKEEKAEIIEYGLSDLYIGDSIIVDGIKDEITIYRKGNMIDNRKLFVLTEKMWLKKVREAHKL